VDGLLKREPKEEEEKLSEKVVISIFDVIAFDIYCQQRTSCFFPLSSIVSARESAVKSLRVIVPTT
jgi:hypothetical protein